MLFVKLQQINAESIKTDDIKILYTKIIPEFVFEYETVRGSYVIGYSKFYMEILLTFPFCQSRISL